MSEKKAKKSISAIAQLVAALKVDEKVARELAVLEKTLLMQKANREANKQKVTRQKMRARKFYRHEHTAETIALLQHVASTL